ncbi:centrosomal protein of 70 kDa-like [Lingula anatina]|uniref:Centrosomal protein of 70 kDa n=1 Tax=Lingula anatina TaxID=7574 RepID=A0A1S3J642_LINAN|nr:centrosomal protein of 70 kDa-like [Lingula anatina]|eukprot:XP_013405309.1 centrosomal protein of 70 kDa-like [Lingula anatina]
MPAGYILYYKNLAAQGTCECLGVFDLRHITPKIEKQQNAVEAFPRLEQFAKDVLKIVNSERAPKLKDFAQRTSHKREHAVWCERTWSHVLPTLEFWVQELASLRELQQSVNKLSTRLAPFTYRKLVGDAKVSQIISAIDALTFEGGVSEEPDGTELPSGTVLKNIVEHFQNLFDVESVNGVYPRMNEIYSKLGEVHNVLRSLRDLLGLPEDAKSTAIVDAVGKLCQQHTSTTWRQLKQLLEEEDLDSVRKRLEQHDEFFPVFQEMMDKLMDILGVSRIDQVIPAVRALKLLTE